MNAVMYARVSDAGQADKDLSIPSQLKAMKKYAEQEGYIICNEFIDEAKTARTANRPEFQRMIALAKRRDKPFETILVWKLSRFARNREDSIVYKSLLRKHGINVISVSEKFDDSPSGKLLEGMIEAIDEFYSSNLAVEAKRGMMENASMGYCNGSTAPIGYNFKRIAVGKTHKSCYEPDPIYKSVVKRIFDLYLSGNGAKAITNLFNAEGITNNKGKSWSSQKIIYILKNETYTGTYVWNKRSNRNKNNSKVQSDSDKVIRIENNHPPIIEKETFEKVQKLIKERSPKITHPRTINSSYLLSSIIFCKKCKSAMIGASAKSGEQHYYMCNKYRKSGKSECDSKSVNRKLIEPIVIQKIKNYILTDENLIKLIKLVNKDLVNSKEIFKEQMSFIEAKLNETRNRLDKLYDAVESGKIELELLAPRLKKVKQEADNLEEKKLELIETMKNSNFKKLDMDMIKHYVSDLKDLLGKGSIMEQRSFLKTFIKKIEVDRPEVKITYTIPMQTKKNGTSIFEVLSADKFGTPGRIRTCDTRIRNPMLYPTELQVRNKYNLSYFH